MASAKKKSPLWEYFDINSENNKLAVCLLCNVNISRGGEGKKAGMYLINLIVHTSILSIIHTNIINAKVSLFICLFVRLSRRNEATDRRDFWYGAWG